MSEHPYPGYDILGKWNSASFNDQTRRVLNHRLNQVPERQFFTEEEWAVLEAFCARAIPQPGRVHRVPIAPWIDQALVHKRGSGTRYAQMPTDAVAWRRGLVAFEAEAQRRHRRGFAQLMPHEQDALMQAAVADELTGPEWQGMSSKTFMADFALKHVVAIYYAHPVALSEIGYGGPASPRGYVRMDANRFDAWEAPAGKWHKEDGQ